MPDVRRLREALTSQHPLASELAPLYRAVYPIHVTMEDEYKGPTNEIIQEMKKFLERKREKYRQKVLESPQYKEQEERLYKIISDFNRVMGMCRMMAIRPPEFDENSLFFRSTDDLLESSVSILTLCKDGMRNPARREMRYMIELSIHAFNIDQEMRNADLDSKLIYMDRQADTSSIRPLYEFEFPMIGTDLQDDFVDRVRTNYGEACTYVHPSFSQAKERLDLVAEGKTIGFETEEELKEMNCEIFNHLSTIIVFAFHALGSGLTGDLLVGGISQDGGWEYHKDKFVASVDSHFDYKHERQDSLEEIREKREKRLSQNWAV
jgi:hypothetical protein